MRYKIIGNKLNGTVYHSFPLGAFVTLESADPTDDSSSLYRSVDDSTIQIVRKADVEIDTFGKQQAAEKLSELVTEIHQKLTEATTLADEHGLEFDLYPAYGMGGTYYGAGHERIGGYYGPEQGWNSSSQSC